MAYETSSASKGQSTLFKVAIVLAAIGAINWGLIGFFNWNLVDAIFGGGANEITSAASRVVYALVGIAGLLAVFLMPSVAPSETHRRMEAAPHSR